MRLLSLGTVLAVSSIFLYAFVGPALTTQVEVDPYEELRIALVTKDELGPRVWRAVDQGSVQLALQEVRKAHPELIPHGELRDGILLCGSSSDSRGIWFVVTDSVQDLNNGEKDVLDVVYESPWTNGRVQEHWFTNEVRGVSIHNHIRFDSEHGTRRSSYSWAKNRLILRDLRGSGSDLALPIVDSEGATQAFIVFSDYASNYGNTKTMQYLAIRAWRDATVARARKG